jgi:Arc/MetJ family transcription regulator
VIDLVKDHEPGRVFTYEEFGDALSAGADKTFTVPRVRAAVVSATPRLLREQQRALHNVRLVGYRLAFAKEHSGLALMRRRRADIQTKRALHLLRHVRWEEMDENTRNAHQGHLMVTEALMANQVAQERRISAIENVIASLRK